MRRVPQNRPLTTTPIEHEHAKELDEISRVLDATPEILGWVENDIVAPGIDRETGRPGLTAEQTLRALIVKQMNGFSYTELASTWQTPGATAGSAASALSTRPPSGPASTRTSSRSERRP